jgi:hypothetical protein
MRPIQQALLGLYIITAPIVAAFIETVIQLPNIPQTFIFFASIKVNPWIDVFFQSLHGPLLYTGVWIIIGIFAVNILWLISRDQRFRLLFGFFLLILTIILIWTSIYLAGWSVYLEVCGINNWGLLGIPVYSPKVSIFSFYVAHIIGLVIFLFLIFKRRNQLPMPTQK